MNFDNRAVLSILLLALVFSFTIYNNSYAGSVGISGDAVLPISETDTNNYQLYSFYDLRNRESFVQATSPDSASILHVQVFDVGNLCNENNFFDTYTANDTHVYNLRDLNTNNGNSAGFVLPDGAYGFVVITAVQGQGQPANTEGNIIGNFRVIDNTGYEYRTNSQGPSFIVQQEDGQSYTFNFNTLGGVNASDVIGITLDDIDSGEVTASGSSLTFDTTLFNNSEVEFSCSDTTFSCTSDTFEYGINDAIPNSRDGSVVCGSNVISEGLVKLDLISSSRGTDAFAGYVGLNNGNGRGSMDSFHQDRGEFGTGCELNEVCRVFVTNTTQIGNFGLGGADAICQGQADGSMMTQGGTYLAWLSTTLPDVSPNTRFNQASVPYQLVDGTQVANNYAGLIDGEIDNNINLTASGGALISSVAWTGTNADGTPNALNCSNWSDSVNSSGRLGTAINTATWTSSGDSGCGSALLLYCFEQ